MTSREKHDRMANAIRFLSMDAVEAANSGHPGLPMGAADVATVLFSRFMKFDPINPSWPDRDRFVLSAGHGSMLLYSLLYLLGYEDITIDEIRNFRQLGSKTAGHPEYGHAAGIETTTGPLGQGLSNSVGMALAERMMAAQFGDDLVDHHTYVIASDGDLMEGISHEAISIAGHLRLNKLIVFFDNNSISIDGPLSLAETGDQVARFQAAGWNTIEIDGHNVDEISAAIEAAQKSDRPTMIACKTIIGFGFPTRAGTQKAHSDAPGEEEIAGARKKLGWDAPPFEIPADIRDAWRIAGLKSSQNRKEWTKRLAAAPTETRAEFERRQRGDLPPALDAAMAAYKKTLADEKPKVATRKASEMALEVINATVPETVGGSADLTPSNNTRTKGLKEIAPGDYSGRYVHWGVREHGMAGAMNGMALHGGLIPYGGSFLTFTDYCRPSIRLAALMGNRVIFVMTHDSIGLGEDGPTHQPVEHLSALRAIPNLNVFRPADAMETAECWQLALAARRTPSVLALTRQGVPALRTEFTEDNLCARGAYEISPADGDAEVSLSLRFPLKDVIEDGEVDWKAVVNTHGVASQVPVEGRKVSNADVAMTITPDEMTIYGKAKIDGVGADVSMSLPVGDGGEGTETEVRPGERQVRLVLEDEARKRLGVGLDDVLSGTVTALVTDGDDGAQHYELDLRRARVVLRGLGWSKGKGVPATLSFDLAEDKDGRSVSNLVLKGDGFGMSGSARLDSASNLISAEVDSLRLRKGDSLSLRLTRGKGGYAISARGSSFDLRGLIAQVRDNNDQAGGFPDIAVDAQIDKLIGYNQEVITGAKLTLVSVGGEMQKLSFSGAISGTPASLEYAVAPAGTSLDATAADGGRLFRFLDLYTRIAGGRIQVTGRGRGNGPMVGSMEVADFNVINEPTMEKVGIGRNAPGGRVDGFNPRNVHFDRMVAQFSKTPRAVVIEEALLRGAAIGATFSGRYDLKAATVSLAGTYLPAYAFNNLFSKIPLIGVIAGGGFREGLIGVTFKVEGPIAAPRVFFNPLSAVAPGIFRKIFEFQPNRAAIPGQ